LNRNREPEPARELGIECLETAATVVGELGCEEDLRHAEIMLEEAPGPTCSGASMRTVA